MSQRQTMAQVAAQLAAEKAGANGAAQAFPFWNAPPNSSSIVRFLPNLDQEALPLPYVRKMTISLRFAGIVNSEDAEANTEAEATVRVPSLQQWGLKCYINEANRPVWDSDRDLAREYWRKLSYVFACMVISTPVEGSWTGRVVPVTLNKSLYERVHAGLIDADCEYPPWDYDAGRDFKIIKTMQGQYANYGTSSFAMKERALSDEERAVATQGLIELRDHLGVAPDAATQAAIQQMYHASMAGEPFDAGRFPMFRAYRRSTDAVAAASAPKNGGSNGGNGHRVVPSKDGNAAMAALRAKLAQGGPSATAEAAD